MSAGTDKPLVMHVIHSLSLGGAEAQVIDLASGLSERYHTVVVCTLGLGQQADKARAAGVEVVSLDLGSGRDPRILTRLASLMRRLRPDIVHSTNFSSTSWGRAAALFAGVPVSVIAEHGTARLRTTERLAVPLSNRLLRAKTDAAVACAESQVDFLASEHVPRDRIEVIPNGIDPGSFDRSARNEMRSEWGVGDETFVVGLVAELRPEKNVSMLLDAGAIALGRGIDLQIAIVGEGVCQADLEAQAAGMGERVSFLGWRWDIDRVLSGLDAVALTSTSEALPLCLLEAMATGVPVVTTDVGDAARVVSEGVSGFIVPSQDTEAFAERLQTLARDPGMRESFGRAGRERVAEHYSISAMLRGYEQLFDRLLDRDEA